MFPSLSVFQTKKSQFFKQKSLNFSNKKLSVFQPKNSHYNIRKRGRCPVMKEFKFKEYQAWANYWTGKKYSKLIWFSSIIQYQNKTNISFLEWMQNSIPIFISSVSDKPPQFYYSILIELFLSITKQLQQFTHGNRNITIWLWPKWAEFYHYSCFTTLLCNPKPPIFNKCLVHLIIRE